jgi:diaminopimelate epimerase
MNMMDAGDMRRGISLEVAGRREIVHFMVVGTRHAVMFVDDVDALTGEDVLKYGRSLRHAAAFAPQGANVNFASLDSAGVVHLRTYEKGVEAETHACGTGSVVASVLLAHDGRLSSPVTVVQRSGDELVVSFELVPTGATRVTLEGPAAINFEGSFQV